MKISDPILLLKSGESCREKPTRYWRKICFPITKFGAIHVQKPAKRIICTHVFKHELF